MWRNDKAYWATVQAYRELEAERLQLSPEGAGEWNRWHAICDLQLSLEAYVDEEWGRDALEHMSPSPF